MAASEPASLPTLRQLLAQVHLRLILFAVTLAAASLLVSGTVVIRNYAQKNLELIASTVSYTVEPAIVFGDPAAVREGMISVAGTAAVDKVEVLDPAGKAIAEWHNPQSGLYSGLTQLTNRLLWAQPSVRQVRQSGQVIGQVRVYGNSEGILRYTLSGAIIALACLGLTVFATRILARRLDQQVIAPLSELVDAAHAVRSERAFHRRLPPAGVAEIDLLANDVNALLGELEGRNGGLAGESLRRAGGGVYRTDTEGDASDA